MKYPNTLIIFLTAGFAMSMESADLFVPTQYKTIQSALDAANEKDRIIVEPGVYKEEITLPDKAITLASRFIISNDREDIRATRLDGVDAEGNHNKRTLIRVPKTVSSETRICGLTIENANDGITCSGNIEIDNNQFFNNKDAIDYEGGGGICRDNLFEKNIDDAIDLDGKSAVRILRNQLLNNRDDGIEIRMNPYRGPELLTVIEDNEIRGNGEDGIQFIDYDGVTDRMFVISGNRITDSAMAGIAFMSEQKTREDYRAAPLDETVRILDNDISSNRVGLAISGNVVLENNRIMNNQLIGLLAGGTLLSARNNTFSGNPLPVGGTSLDWESNQK